MKKNKVIYGVIASVIVILILSRAFSVQAEDHSDEAYYITSYHVDIYVWDDNVLSITEEIDVHFNQERHGIYRTIPKRNEILRADGSRDVTRAKIRGIYCSEEYKKTTQNSDIILQIGDPDRTVTGDMHYTISYDYYLGRDVADGYDELYFNIIGSGWDTYIDGVSFSITMPKEFDSSLLGFSTGGYGVTGTNLVEYDVEGLEISGYLTQELEPYEALTVRLELEEGYFYFNMFVYALQLSSMILIPLACLGFVVAAWIRHGRDKKLVHVVEFYPPAGMSSTDAAYWYKGKLPKKDIIALLIELANEGYIFIHDGDEKGKKDSSGYNIQRVKEYPEELDWNKKLFFDGLFESGKDVVTGSDLENKFYRTLDKIHANYGYSGTVERVHSLTSTRMQLLCWTLTIGCLIVNFAILVNLLGGGERFLPFGIGALILAAAFLLSCYVSKRTDESHEKLEKLSGFRLFLQTAEKEKLEALVHENPKYFYDILPFAYVLDVSDKWIKKFEGIAMEPPEWYSGYGEYTTAAMWSSMHRTLVSATKSMSAVPRESSSGGGSGGGGGVSGGGSGGGGGGSW